MLVDQTPPHRLDRKLTSCLQHLLSFVFHMLMILSFESMSLMQICWSHKINQKMCRKMTQRLINLMINKPDGSIPRSRGDVSKCPPGGAVLLHIRALLPLTGTESCSKSAVLRALRASSSWLLSTLSNLLCKCVSRTCYIWTLCLR